VTSTIVLNFRTPPSLFFKQIKKILKYFYSENAKTIFKVCETHCCITLDRIIIVTINSIKCIVTTINSIKLIVTTINSVST